MLQNQLSVELKRAYTEKNLYIWLSIIFVLPLISYFSMMQGYIYHERIELFQSLFSTFIPLLFPVLTIIIYLPNFLYEQKNNIISYTKPRVSLRIYLLSKGLINAFLTGFITFLMIFISFIFARYIEPNLGIIDYFPIPSDYSQYFTFSQILSVGDFTYGSVYSLWVSINAIVYSTIAYILMLLVRSNLIALSVPFVFYHVFNYVSGVLQVPQFSPISTIFPFNIEQQPLWTVLVPFSFLLISLIGLLLFALRNRGEWVIYSMEQRKNQVGNVY
ncbi:ABC transporter permease [Peribacillus butanolivorans]|uniref:ABC transporter permease n=1 Tax=Peribacillus butanolivorans TaxID=421767 RepID=UPI00207D2999|nr:ABC transporter permease [Peribacillus butanolivorans]MCO0601382.1 ABC transporter permease [Peribacillus butanolivorans]